MRYGIGFIVGLLVSVVCAVSAFAKEPVLVAESAEKDARLYVQADKILLEFNGISEIFEWGAGDYVTYPPLLDVSDHDNDGVKDVAVVLGAGRGTGVFLEDLRIVRVENGNLKDYAYNCNDYVNDVAKLVTYEIVQENGKTVVSWQADGGKISSSKDITDILVEYELSGSGIKIYVGDIVRFTLKGGGVIEAMAPVGFSSDENATPIYIGIDQTAQVVFADGAFKLEKFSLQAD